MICTLTEEQQRSLRKKVYKDLSVILKTDKPFTVKEYINSIYTQVLQKSNNPELALAYSALLPRYIDQLKSVDDDIRRGLRSKGVNSDVDITDNIDKFEDPEKGLNNVREYLGLSEDIAKEVRELNESLKEETKQQEEKKETPPIPKEKKVTPQPAANFSHHHSEKEFSAVKPTVMADQDQEAIEWRNKKSPNYNKVNPVVAFYFKIKRMILSKIFSPGANQSSKNISVNPLIGQGVYLRLMPIRKLDRNKIRPVDLEPLKDGQPSNWDSNEPVLVLTDRDGSVILFNDNGEFDVNGKPAYYYFRKVYPSQVRDGKVDLWKSSNPNTPDDYDRANSLARQKGMSKEEAIDQIRKELQIAYDLRQALKANPDLMIRSEITGGSFGYPAMDYNINTPISSINFGNNPVSFYVAPMTDPTTGVIKGRTYFQTAETGSLPIEVERPALNSINGMVDRVVDLMFKNILVPIGNVMSPITSQQRHDFIQQYFMTRGEGLDFITEEDGSYKVKIRGEVIYKSLPTRKKEKDGTWTYIDKYSPEVLSAKKAEADMASAQVKNYLSTLSPQTKIESPTDAEKARSTSNPAEFRVGSIYKAADGTYWRVGYPKANISSAYIRSDFKDVTVEEKDGNFILNIKVRPYSEYIRENFTIHYPINSDGKLTKLNAYFTFEPLQEDLEKIYEKEEPTRNVPVDSPSIEESDITIKDAKSGLDAALDDPTLNKELDQKNANKKATKEQIDAAKIWYENLSWKDKKGKTIYFKDLVPFEVMFNMVNSKNPRAVATWTLQGITLYKGSDYSDLYHEAWHAFTQAFLTKKQKKDLYDEVRKKSGSFTDYKGRRVSFKYATDKQIEEYLAEDFREWMLSGNKYEIKEPVKRNIFQKILSFLEFLFGNITISQLNADAQALRSIHTLYEKLRVGNLSEYSFSQENTNFNFLDKGAVALKEDAYIKSLNYEDSRFIVEAIDSFMSKFVDDFSRGKRNQLLSQVPDTQVSYKWTSTLLKTTAGLTYAYQQVRKDLIAVRNGLADRLSEASEEEKPSLQKQINRLDWAIDNFGDVDNIANNRPGKDGVPKGVISYHMLKSKVLEVETKESFFEEDFIKEQDMFLRGREGYDRGGNEVSMKDLASKEILFILRSLHKVDVNGQPVYVKGTESESEGVKTGIIQLEDFEKVWNVLAKLLQNTLSAEKMYEKMISYGEKHPEFPMKQLLSKLGPLSTSGTVEFHLWTNFWQTFNKTRVPLLQTTVEVNTIDNDGQPLHFENWSFDIRSGVAFTDTRRIEKEWQERFSVEETDYIKPDGGGVNTLDLDKVIEDFPLSSLPGRELQFLRAIGFRLDENNEDISNALKNGDVSVVPFWYVVNNLRMRRDSKGRPAIRITRIDQLKEEYPEVPKRNSNGKIIDYEKIPALKGEGTNFNAILQLQARYSDKWGNFMVTNVEGNTQFEHTLNSSLTVMINTINDVSSYEELISLPWMKHLDVKRNPYAEASLWLRSIFDMNDKYPDGRIRGMKRLDKKGRPVFINLQNLSGIAVKKDDQFDNDLGVASAKADPISKLVMELHMVLLKGAPELPRHADKSTSFTVYLSSIYTHGDKSGTNYVDTLDFLRTIRDENNEDTGITMGDVNLVDNILIPHISAELSRIKQMREMDAKRKKDKTSVQNFDFNYMERGKGFVAFADVLTTDTKKALLKLEEDLVDFLNTNSPEAKKLKTAISNDVQAYFRNESARVGEMFNKAKNRNGKPLISDNLYKKIIDNANKDVDLRGKFNKNSAQLKDILVKSFVVNSWVHNLESISIIYGDLALYNMAKEEFHKRNAGVGSTGTIYRTDSQAINYVNNVLGRGYRSKNFPGLPVKQFDGTFDTAVVEDNILRSVYFKEYVEAMIQDEIKRGLSETEAKKKVLGVDKSGKIGTIEKPIKGGLAYAYQEMNEGDAQGWITFDSYRILLTLEGKWTEAQEKMYQKIIAGETVKTEDLTMFFPPQKVQYFGPLKTEGLPITAHHKFSLFPLIPTAIQGTRLKNLHDKMVAEGIDYALFQSGSKVGTITKDSNNDKLYADKKDRVISDVPFTKNTIFLNYLKNQLEIAPKFKKKVIFPTQLRKLIEDGLFEGGVPTDFKPHLDLDERRKAWEALGSEQARFNASNNYRLSKQYENNVKKLTDLKKEELLEEIGWSIVGNELEGSIENLLRFVRKELTNRDLADHEIDFIDLGSGGKKIKHDLSMSLSAEKIEKLLNAIVTKRLVKQKVNGESLIQVSGAGFENVSSTGRNYTNPTEADKAKWGTNDLPTYQRLLVNAKDIYNKLGTKTQSENVLIDEVAGRKPATEVKKILTINDVLKEYSIEDLMQAVRFKSLRDKIKEGDFETIKAAYNYLKAEEKYESIKKNNEIINKEIERLREKLLAATPTKVGSILTITNDENGSEYKAKVLEIERYSDYAILKVKAANNKEYTIRVNPDGTTKTGFIENFIFEGSGEDPDLLKKKIDDLKSQLQELKTDPSDYYIDYFEEQFFKPIIAYNTRGNNFLEALEKDNAIGNPFGPYGQFKTPAGRVAVEEFIAWMIGERHTDKLQDYRQAIIDKIKSGELKGKKILYYKDLGEPSHATALDYLINKINLSERYGKTKAMKVKIAMQGQFKKLLNLRDKDGNRIRTVERLNQLLKDDEWLDMNEHRRMITMVGVRIPTQSLNSMEFMEVYEFLPEEAGNIIIPPAEIVAKSGSDFDIDKLTVMMPSYRTQRDKDGNISVVMSRQTSDEEAKILYEMYKDYKIKSERLKTEVSPRKPGTKTLEDLTIYNNLMYEIFGISAEELDDEMKEMLIEEGKMLSYEQFFRKLNGTKAVENDIIWDIKSILELPENFVNLIRPNSTDIAKPIADELASKVNDYDPKQRLSGDISPEDAEELSEPLDSVLGTRVFEIGYNLYKHSSNNIGKETLGLGAVDNTFNTIFNRIGAYMNPEAKVVTRAGRILRFRQTLLMPHNTLDVDGKRAISLSHVLAKDGNRISDVISQLINGWVDVAKDSWIFNIQGNKEITPTLLFMIQAGVPLKTAIYLVSQPIVREYVEAQRKAKSTFGDLMGTAGDNINFYRNEARRFILSNNKYGFNLDTTKVKKQNKAYLYEATLDLTEKAFAKDNGQITDSKLLEEINKHAEAIQNGKEPEYSEYQRAAFLHFLEIEEMAKAVRDIKIRLNFDTNESTTLFDAQNRILILNELKENGRIPEEIVDNILEHTVIGNFYIQPFQLRIWKDLFSIRNNPILNNWLADKMQEGIMDDISNTFGDPEKFVNQLRNDLLSFIFQNVIKAFDIDKITHYKGEIIEGASSSKLNEKELVRSLAIGVFFKNGKVYVDKESLRRQYTEQLYCKKAYSDFGLAKVSPGTFESQEEYNHFVFEREYLRSIYPTVTSLKNNVEYNWIAKNLKTNTKRLQDETDEQFIERTDRLAYEEFIKEKALENIFNGQKLFKGENTYADKLVMIKNSFPELLDRYPVLKKLVASPSRVGGTEYTNIQLQDSLSDPDNINLYYENMLDLMDYTVKKVDDAASNKMISEFFSKLPLVGFLQSGLNTKSQMSFGRIMPQDSFIRMMEQPVKEYVAKLNPLALDVFYRKFIEQNNNSRKRLRNRYKNYFVPGFNLDKSYELFKQNRDTYLPTEYTNIEREVIEKDYRGIETFDAEVINAKIAEQVAKDNPDKVFVYNDAFQSMQKAVFPGEYSFKGLPVSNKVGLPTYRFYSITKASAIQDVNDDVNPEIKAKIDEAIENMKALQKEGKTLVFSSRGYGQEWNGVYKAVIPKEEARIKAPKTFLYLSEQLYRNFGYINPGYQIKREGRTVIQEGQEITDEMVRDYMSHCYR